MRAFIFSLDAFVAFTLALIAIYSLIFFSSVPSSYYFLLTQGHFLARDVLVALSTTECDVDQYGACHVTGSQLDNIVSNKFPSALARQDMIRATVGNLIPNQFGYSFDVSDDEGENWYSLYDTSTSLHPNEAHTGKGKKMVVTSQMISFGYTDYVTKEPESIYWYRTCGDSESGGIILTCDDSLNTDPSLLGDQVPEIHTRLIRITIFI